MTKHKIAVISDTHSTLRPEIIEKVKECERIIHAGDIASKGTMEEIELYGLKIFIIHNRRQIPDDLSGRDIIIYGHSHKYSEEYKENICYFNPGSCGPRRFHQEITMAVLTIDETDQSFTFEKVDCSPILTAGSAKLPGKDMEKLISRIMKQMDADKPVEEIAGKNRIDEELVRQILQIYTTHQGIDVQGILDRME